MSSPTFFAGTRGELFGFRDVQGFRKLIQIGAHSQRFGPMSALPPKADIGIQPCDVRFVPKADISRHQFGLEIEGASTLYAAIGRRMPLRLNSRTDSTVMVLSTASITRGLIRIWPGLASSQSRDATLETVPIAA